MNIAQTFNELDSAAQSIAHAQMTTLNKLIQRAAQDFKVVLVPKGCAVGMIMQRHVMFVPSHEKFGVVGWINTVPVFVNDVKCARTRTGFVAQLNAHGTRLVEELQ